MKKLISQLTTGLRVITTEGTPVELLYLSKTWDDGEEWRAMNLTTGEHIEAFFKTGASIKRYIPKVKGAGK